MGNRITYHKDQLVGDHKAKFIKELLPNISKGGNVNRTALFKCGYCETEFRASISEVKRGNTKSCGCKTKEFISKSGLIHGLIQHPTYKTWESMKSRCYNKNNKRYGDYGGREITICDEWKNNFKNFYDWSVSNGYKRGLSIDRINNDGNYEPSNCRWTTKTIQSRNRRCNKNSSSKYAGVSRLKNCDRWKSSIKINGKNNYIGIFMSEIDAAKARDTFIKNNNLHGFILNFE